MYKLIIVDDEAYILNQLAALFDWPSLGMELVGSFTGIEPALTYLQHHPVDVLLTDIRLGREFGLDLVKASLVLNPELEVILISAFSEFEYAREAIKLNVFDYLLKPVNYESISNCFLRLKQAIDGKRNLTGGVDDAIRQIRQKLADGEPFAAGRFLELITEYRNFDADRLKDFLGSLLEEIAGMLKTPQTLIEDFRNGIRPLSAVPDILFTASKQMYLLSAAMSELDYHVYYIEVAKKFIDDHIGKDLSLESVAAHVALSPSYFSRYFRQQTGERFVDYLCQARIRRAIELLADPQIQINQIHQMVGYCSYARFYSVFLKKTGYTPSEYRKTLQKTSHGGCGV